jgi:acetylornithine deacetylase
MIIPGSEQIEREIELRLPKATALLAELTALNSVFGQEGAVQAVMRAEMERLGLDINMVKSRPDESGVNLAGRLRGQSPRDFRSLALNAHADIVPVDAHENWRFPPFQPTIEGGLLHGRGAQDDKAGLVLLLLVAETLIALGRPLAGDLELHSVIEEETSGNGARALTAAGHQPDGVIICDGAWPARIFYAHPGHVSAIATVRGDAVAAANLRRAVNPVQLGLAFVSRIEDEVRRWNGETPQFCGITEPHYVNVGALHAGAWCGSVPAQAVLHLQIGFAPPQSAECVFGRIKDIAASLSDRIVVEAGPVSREPYRGKPDSLFIRDLKAIADRHSQEPLQVVPVSGYTDMGAYRTADICLYGPGGGRNAHGVDEHYILDHMLPVARNIVQFALSWCNRRRDEAN